MSSLPLCIPSVELYRVMSSCCNQKLLKTFKWSKRVVRGRKRGWTGPSEEVGAGRSCTTGVTHPPCCCLVKLIGEGMLEMNWKENKLTLKQKYALSSLQLLVFNSEHNLSWRILWQNLFKYSKKSQTDLKSTIKVTIDKKVIL